MAPPRPSPRPSLPPRTPQAAPISKGPRPSAPPAPTPQGPLSSMRPRPSAPPAPTPQAAQTLRRPRPSFAPAPTTQTKPRRLQFPDTTHHGGVVAGATERGRGKVIGRIRDLSSTGASASALEVAGDGTVVRVRGCRREFTLDGVSVSEEKDLGEFYRQFVRPVVQDVQLGAKRTVMVYGPTGSGKTHTMFGSGCRPGNRKEQGEEGIVHRALCDILEGGGGDGGDANSSSAAGSEAAAGLSVHVSVLEIHNETVFDLAGAKGNAAAKKLNVAAKQAQNATKIYGTEARNISTEVATAVECRTVKSTLCNEKSSRSHCMIILDVPSVGGRLILVDMAGSENIEAAGQTGPPKAKQQTGKINQGNTAFKRVVQCIAKGDPHVPFRDSKLTMLLQDSFEDDKSKILMILCASPDPNELHKTVSTLEYGAKARHIAAPATIPRDKMRSDQESSTMLNSRLDAMNKLICDLQEENRQREKEVKEARSELTRKEEEVEQLRAEQLRQQEELTALKQRLQEVQREKADAHQPLQQEMTPGLDKSVSTVISMDIDTGDQQQDDEVIKEDTSRHQQGHIWNHTSPADVSLFGYRGKFDLDILFEEVAIEEEGDPNKENSFAGQEGQDGLLVEVHIKWVSKLGLDSCVKLLQNSCLSDLRKRIEKVHFEQAGSKEMQQFTFQLGDCSSVSVSREEEASMQISKLPHWKNQPDSYLVLLQAAKKPAVDRKPFSPLDSKLNSVVKDAHHAGVLSPKPTSSNYIRKLRELR